MGYLFYGLFCFVYVKIHFYKTLDRFLRHSIMKQVKLEQMLLFELKFLEVEVCSRKVPHKVLLGQLRLTDINCFVPKPIKFSPACACFRKNVNFYSA